MRLPLFDDVDRVDASPKKHGEPTFRFFNRVAGTYWNQSRDLAQAWANKMLDDEAYAALRSNLRSSNDYVVRSAFLELYIHELLTRNGRPVWVHPPVAGSRRRPDFLVRTESGSAYFEAISPAASKATQGEAGRVEQFYAVIDELNDENFMLWIDELTPGLKPVSASTVRRRLRAWLSSLDQAAFDPKRRPVYAWVLDDWSGAISVWPRGRPLRQDGFDRGIGV